MHTYYVSNIRETESALFCPCGGTNEVGGSSHEDVGDSVIRCVYKEVSNLGWIWGKTNKKKGKTTANRLEQINSTSRPRVIQVSDR